VFLVLTLHGALWVNLKTSGELQQKSRCIASSVYWAASAAVFAITVCSFLVQLQPEKRFTAHLSVWRHIAPDDLAFVWKPIRRRTPDAPAVAR